MTSSLLTLTHMEKGVRFYHVNDELLYLEWLRRISCVETIDGDGKFGLVVYLKRRPTNNDLRQFLAVFKRYGVNMRQLAKFETAANRSWFRDPRTYWYTAVFGRGKRKP